MPFESRYSSLKGIITAIASFTITSVLVLTGATITGPLIPTTSDGAAIGSATKMWSDLFLASGGVINWNNGNMTITHAADTLTTAGGNITINDTGANPVLTVKRTGGYSPLRLYSTGDGTHNEGNYDIYAYGTGGSQNIIFEPANWGSTVQFRGNSGVGVWNGVKITMENADVSNKGNALFEVFNNDVMTASIDSGILTLAETTVPSSASGYGKLWVSSADNRLHFVSDDGETVPVSRQTGYEFYFNCGEAITRFSVTSGGTGGFTYSTPRCDMTTGATGTSYTKARLQHIVSTGIKPWGTDYTQKFTFYTQTFDADNPEAYLGNGDPTVSGAGHTWTASHIGFEIKRESGVINLYATNANGTTQTKTLMTTLASTDLVSVVVDYDVGVSAKFYYRKNGGAWSTATTHTTNFPSASATSDNYINMSASNVATAATARIGIISGSFVDYRN